MIRIENAASNRWTGSRIVVWSFILGLVSYLPLQLYIWFGPADGNPIGLGLLAFFGLPAAALGVLIGLVRMLVQLVARGRTL